MTDGTVIIIGGAEDKVRDRVILSRFVTLAGGRDATIAVISHRLVARRSRPASATEQVFGELGVKQGPAAPRGDPAAGQRRDGGPAPSATRPASS